MSDSNHNNTSSQDSESDSESGEGDRPGWEFVEYYPNNWAGTPIDMEPMEEFDLGAYISSCGLFADPKVFHAAELLVASNLTNSQ